MAPFWSRRFLVPIYGFGVALILTLGAGSVLGSSSAALTEAEANVAASEERVIAAEQRRGDAERRATEAEARAQAAETAANGVGTSEPPTTPTRLIVRVITRNGERLDAPSEQEVVISYSVRPSVGEKSQKLNPDGVFAVARPQGEVTDVCVKQPKKWRVTPETKATPDRNPGVACITPPSRPPQDELRVDFQMDPA